VVDGSTYTLCGKVGDGAVGIVRRATHGSENKNVAIKFLAPDAKYIEESSFDDVASRFKHEGQRGSRLEHSRLVKILGYAENLNGKDFLGDGPKNPFLIMEYVSGRTLESEIRATDSSVAGTFDIDRTRLFLAIQIADAVKHVHHHRLVHRDVKPANIFISGRTRRNNLPLIKLGDFGIVKWGDFHSAVATGTLTMTHQQGLGTLKYMSPEQAIRPKDVTPNSDMFSFGITLYELFTGRILISPHHVYQVMSARLSRGQTFSRYLELGHRVGALDEHLCSKLLDCFLRGVDGRPRIDEMLGCLAAAYSRDYDISWQEELM
jgi:serine/threonine protein kinase